MFSVCENIFTTKNKANYGTSKLRITQEFCMVGGYMEAPAKPQNYQNLEIGTCKKMGTCF